jgi:hypothetical protein
LLQLPGLARLRRLTIAQTLRLSAPLANALSTALAGCVALDELSLSVKFVQDDGGTASGKKQQSRWSALLRSVPHLVRLVVTTTFVGPFLLALATHLPRLEQLLLVTRPGAIDFIVRMLSHPTLQQLEVMNDRDMTAEEVASLLHNPRLPQLRSCASL